MTEGEIVALVEFAEKKTEVEQVVPSLDNLEVPGPDRLNEGRGTEGRSGDVPDPSEPRQLHAEVEAEPERFEDATFSPRERILSDEVEHALGVIAGSLETNPGLTPHMLRRLSERWAPPDLQGRLATPPARVAPEPSPAPAERETHTRREPGGPGRSPEEKASMLLDRIRETNARMTARQHDNIDDMQAVLDGLAGTNLGSFALNDALAREVQQWAKVSGLGLFYEGRKVNIRCTTGVATGYFQARSADREQKTMFNEEVFPPLVVAPPMEGPAVAERAEDLVSVSKAAQELSLDEATVRWHIRNGNLDAQRVGKKSWAITRPALDAFKERLPATRSKRGPKPDNQQT